MSLSTKSSSTKLQKQKDDSNRHTSFDILRESNHLSPFPRQEPRKRSIDVYNEIARNRMASLTTEQAGPPSLYAVNRSGDQTNRKSSLSARPSFSIEPRRRSEESFVSARDEEIENQLSQAFPISREVREDGTSFDIGRWTIRSNANDTQFSRGSINMSRSRLPSQPLNEEENDEILYRINSEPLRGGRIVTAPFGNVLKRQQEANIEENEKDINDMKEAVYQVGIFLDQHAKGVAKASKSKDRYFWLAFMGIALTGFLSATDMTIIAPILPTIAEDLPPSNISATWITSSFLLAMMTFQPLWGGLSDAFGRQGALLASLIFFLAGSIPCTVAKSMLTMVVGRGLQGVGGGGMLAIGEVMLSDLTTLAERGYFLGLLSMAFAVAAIAAPLIGGVFATHGGYLGWRWSFLINFPIGVIALGFVLSSNKFQAPPKLTLREKWAHCDATSALILFGSTLSLLIGLTRGGEEYEWNDGRVVAPLVFGIIGLIIFFALQWLPFKFLRLWFLAPRPVLDPKMFFGKGLRTSSISFILTFLHGILLYGAIQTLILYFETRDATPLRAAINVLPANVPSTPAAFIAGVLMAITGRYKLLIIGSQILMLIGLGMLVFLDSVSPTYQWVIFQLIASLGIGAMYTLALPPIQASLPPIYLARATATFAFVRSFGAIWGVSITLIAFSAQANKELKNIPGAYQAGFNGSNAIAKTTSIGLITPIELQTEIRNAFDQSLRVAFSVLVPFAGIGLLLAIFIKHVPLPNFNESEYGLHSTHKEGPTVQNNFERSQTAGTSDLESSFSSPKGRTNQEPVSTTPLRRSDSFWH